MNKAELREIVERLPGEVEVDIDELIRVLEFRREVDKGLAEAEAGSEVSLEEIDEMMAQWPE